MGNFELNYRLLSKAMHAMIQIIILIGVSILKKTMLVFPSLEMNSVVFNVKKKKYQREGNPRKQVGYLKFDRHL